MFLANKKNKIGGFTILELLVVIAIIGILSTVVIGSLSNQRAKAKIAASQATMGSIMPIAITCMDDGVILDVMTTNTGGGEICATTDSIWPELTDGWIYDTSIASDPDTNTFSFSSSDASGNIITCTESTGCVTTLASE